MFHFWEYVLYMYHCMLPLNDNKQWWCEHWSVFREFFLDLHKFFPWPVETYSACHAFLTAWAKRISEYETKADTVSAQKICLRMVFIHNKNNRKRLFLPWFLCGQKSLLLLFKGKKTPSKMYIFYPVMIMLQVYLNHSSFKTVQKTSITCLLQYHSELHVSKYCRCTFNAPLTWRK